MTRHELLEAYGRFYGDEHFAVAFTASIEGDDAKRVVTRGWDQTKPLPTGDYGAGYLGKRGTDHNAVSVLRPSNLIALESDSEQDLVLIEQLGLPQTLTVRSSAPYKRHFYFRPPEELEALPYVAFRFESGKVTADSGRYFLLPPSIHPTGAVYAFLPGLGPGEVDIAELPEHLYRDLCDRARQESDEQRERIAVDPEAKILAGQRRDLIFRYACMLRRWGRPYDAILAECLKFNAERCEPPVSADLVAVQVRGAMKKPGDQELDVAGEPGFTLLVRTAPEILAIPDPPDDYQLLGPLVYRGARTIVVGDTGHGKTTVALQMLAAVLKGETMLGHEGSGVGPALVIDLEQGMRSIKRGLREARLDELDELLYVTVPDGLALDRDISHLAALNTILDEHRPAVVLLDPYYKAHRADDPNAERPIIDLMRQLDALRAMYEFALILPAHPRKDVAGRDGPRKLTVHDVSGSGAATRGAEVVLGLERLGHGYARLRYLKDRDGDLPVGDAVTLLYSKAEGFRLDPRDTSSDEAIEQAILDRTEPWLTVKEWRKLLNVREAQTRGVLAMLADRKAIGYAVGPAGRSATAQCYTTDPKLWDHPGSPEQLPIESEGDPGAPPSLKREGGLGSPDDAVEGREHLGPEDGSDDAWREW